MGCTLSQHPAAARTIQYPPVTAAHRELRAAHLPLLRLEWHASPVPISALRLLPTSLESETILVMAGAEARGAVES